MKSGYTVTNHISKGDNFIVISNYETTNEIYNYSFCSYYTVISTKTKNDQGVWKIKNLK